MKTLSAISRKAHSNVLSLARSPGLSATRSLTPGAVPRQDVRLSGGYLSAGCAWPKSSLSEPSTEKGRDAHRSRFAKGTGNRRRARRAARASFGAAFRRPKSTADPPEESVNETVARLLAGITGSGRRRALRQLSRAPPLVLPTEARRALHQGFSRDDGSRRRGFGHVERKAYSSRKSIVDLDISDALALALERAGKKSV